jgi:hypothetical protein
MAICQDKYCEGFVSYDGNSFRKGNDPAKKYVESEP